MLREDLKTVRGILAKKKEVGTRLRESAAWCRPGVWLIEGPYARFKDAELPEGLRDAIRGIRTRRASRELVERAAPPWLVNVAASGGGDAPNCSIGYLSNGGNWKLFDLDNQVIWTRLAHPERLARDKANFDRFSVYFNIPAWRVVEMDDGPWRSEAYIADANLVHSSSATRVEVLKTLLEQYALFARRETRPADPALTAAAIATLGECAPGSIPARVAERFADAMAILGERIKLLPAHGDLSAQNVFVCGGQPWIIDWDTAGEYQPLLHDLLYLVLREAELGRTDLLTAYLEGGFDEGLRRMFSLCDLSAPPCDNLVLLVHSYIVRFHTRRRANHRDANRQNVESLWNRLQPACAGHL